MLKYLIFVFVLISGALVWINFVVGVPEVYKEEFPEQTVPHLYNNNRQSIGQVDITAVYFIPQNKTGQQIGNWKEILKENLKKLQRFHDLQLQKRSDLTYQILEKPVVGLKNNIEYDSDSTQHGNPEGLRRIAAELEERRITLLRSDLNKSTDAGVYQVVLILYEGVGASGSDNVALISRIFFTDPQYSDIAATTLAHEFYHTLGLPDAYEIPSAIPTSLDIMGLGLSRPLEKNYISREFLKGMGI